MEIQKSVRDVAIKHQLSLGRDHNGYYYIRVPDEPKERWSYSFNTTAKSGLALIRRELHKRKVAGKAVV